MTGPEGSPSRTLHRKGLKPRKRLGQNFLRDRSFLSRIMGAGDIEPEDQVLEIGPGTGVLTRALADRARRVVAVELDDALYALLRDEFAAVPNVEIQHGNALDFDPCRHFAGAYKLVANIPYYITGPILRHFLESPCPPRVIVLMVQREVAERIVAKPGNLNLLGVSVQFYAEPKIITRVPAGAFYPPPKVESAIIRLIPHQARESQGLAESFFAVARAGFGTRRKQLANALGNGLGLSRDEAHALLERSEIEPSRRAETLAVEDWERLAHAWQETRGERP